MTEFFIDCPDCGSSIAVTETLASPLLAEKERVHKAEQLALRRALDLRNTELVTREQQLQKDEEEISRQVAAEVSRQQAITEQRTAQIIEHSNNRVRKAEAMELAARKARESAEQERRAIELQIQREVDARLQTERDCASREANRQSGEKLAEKERMLDDLRRQIALLQRKGTSNSPQLQGDLCELRISNALADHFTGDTISRVKTGARGADILHTVSMTSGRHAGAILIEVKDTGKWQKQWLAKVREDQRAAQANIAIIVSRSLPAQIDQFGCLEGVWVCDEQSLLPLMQSLRHGLLDLSRERLLSAVTGDTSDTAFRYLTGQAFRDRVNAMVESYSALRSDLEKEKRALTRAWQRRQKLLDQLFGSVDGVHADLSAIIGPGLGSIEGLDGIDSLGLDEQTSST